jgi:hypothetical protein
MKGEGKPTSAGHPRAPSARAVPSAWRPAVAPTRQPIAAPTRCSSLAGGSNSHVPASSRK